MKRFLSALLASAALLSAAAQSIVNNPDNAVYWGIRASVDANLPGKWNLKNGSDVKMYRPGAGIHVGAIVNIPLVANLYLEPGAGLFYDTYRYDNLVIPDEEGNVIETDPGVRKFGVRIPLMLGYRFDLSERGSVAVFTGPELNQSLWGKIALKHTNQETESWTKLFGKDGQRRTNVAWNAGVSLEWDYNWVLALTGSFGLSNLHRGDVKFHENRLSISLGYNF